MMKFRFCGNSDCPDWILAIINNLSKLSSMTLKILTQIVAEGIVEPPFKVEKASSLFSDSKLDADLELRGCVACLRFIILSTIKFQCETSAMLSELQQLGLPREHSLSIKKVIDDKQDSVLKKLKSSRLIVNPLESLSLDVLKESNSIVMNITVSGQLQRCTMTKHTASILLNTLKESRSKMEELEAYNQKIF